ncbi:MAG: selenocysteine-specific translation elongation factor [Planctomycetota bacterium]
MEIQPIVIGTAGHIDHGKSTLVRGLTGIDPDRLKEEQERGLTIDLGFAPLELPDGRLVGIVDVPGHEKFVRNMVAGATGIDLVVLVVAADDGVMPQTIEHLAIMEVLGVKQGLIALTKIDMVDAELVQLATDDVRETVRDTFLATAPLVRVSAVTGEGMDELRTLLFELAARTTPRSSEGVFRLPVQRVFSRKGFGTVVTGIPVAGEARVGDVLEVLPGGKRAKVRGLNAYKQTAELVRAGHSSAINFSDLDQRDVVRGSVVATPGFFQARTLLAARFQALRGGGHGSRTIKNRMQVRLHTGTADPPGEIVLLDREEILPGESGLVQLRLADPVVVAPGDRFVLRLLSPVVTLGGGVILEESRYRLKRFKNFVLEELTRQEDSLGDPRELLESVLVRGGKRLIPTDELAVAMKLPKREVEAMLAELSADGRALSPKASRWIHREVLDGARLLVSETMANWFASEAHRTRIDLLELRSRTRLDDDLLRVVLDLEAAAGTLELLPGGKVRARGRRVELPERLQAAASRMRAALVESGLKPPSAPELAELAGLASKEAALVLQHLVDDEEIVHIGGEFYVAAPALDDARAAVVANCEKNGNLVLPELRERLDSTRKYLIPILEFFDGQGLTLRQGGHRILKRR